VDLRNLGELAKSLLRDALDAFVAGDVERAEAVLERDRVLDAQYAAAIERLIATKNDPNLAYTTRAFAVAKYLERIGDHAKNLAEMVVFMVKGQDIRHLTSRTADESGRAAGA
jgi:phosphate transport system protein